MLIESPIGRIDDPSDPSIDWLDLSWIDCTRRAVRAQTRGGRKVRILLKLGATLTHHDLLMRDESGTIGVNLIPSAVIVAHPRNGRDLAALAFKLGDLHVPIELDPNGDLLVMPDGPVEAALRECGIDYELAERRFAPTLRPVVQVSLADDFAIGRSR